MRLNDDSNDNYLQVRVLDTAYNPKICNKAQIIDTTVIKSPNNGQYLLQKCKIECNELNNAGKIQNFIHSTQSNSPTGDSGSTALAPIGDMFMFVESASNNNGEGAFVHGKEQI